MATCEHQQRTNRTWPDASQSVSNEAAAHPYTPWEQQIVQQARRRRVAGTPAQCRERLETLAREYGVDEIVVVTITESTAPRLRSYELLAEAFGLETR